jgi:hypothetical protein
MKQTLQGFTIEPLTGAGSAPKVRVAADVPFESTTGEYHPEGDAKRHYTDYLLTQEGDGWALSDTIFDTTDDSTDPNATYSAWVVNGNKVILNLFGRWSFPASFGTTVTRSALEAYNTHKVPLRDDQAYSKIQINLLLAGLVTPLSVKAVGVATLVDGVAEVSSALVAADSKILITARDPNVSGNPNVTSQTPGVGFTVTSSNLGDNGDVVWILV